MWLVANALDNRDLDVIASEDSIMTIYLLI